MTTVGQLSEPAYQLSDWRVRSSVIQSWRRGELGDSSSLLPRGMFPAGHEWRGPFCAWGLPSVVFTPLGCLKPCSSSLHERTVNACALDEVNDLYHRACGGFAHA